MRGWFHTPERIALLHFKAQRWIGTPFLPNSNVAGRDGGVSCQKLCSEIYRACGCCDIEVPEVAMSHARFSRRSLVEEFMDGQQAFERLGADATMTDGDLLGFKIGRIVHHVGIYLGHGAFIHTIEHLGTIYSMLTDATWGARLAAKWRPRA